MNNRPSDDNPPTMIIPKGTEIKVDTHGQLSIRAPGNLVIQNSGSYGTIESLTGSIRIEPNVEVEAVSVQCGETCYVQGSLTAWNVTARCLHLEDSAKVHIVLQQAERLEVGKEARLVGNFGSEKELFYLFSRFAQQVRSLPFYTGRRLKGDGEGQPPRQLPADSRQAEEAADSLKLLADTEAAMSQDLPDPLFFALVLLEREVARPSLEPETQRILNEVVKLLKERDVETLKHTYRTLFGRIARPSDEVKRAQELLAGHYGASAPRASQRPRAQV